jgi:hypothetical protein
MAVKENLEEVVIEQGVEMVKFSKSKGWKIVTDFIDAEIKNVRDIIELSDALTIEGLRRYQGELKTLNFIKNLPEDNFIEPMKTILKQRENTRINRRK